MWTPLRGRYDGNPALPMGRGSRVPPKVSRHDGNDAAPDRRKTLMLRFIT
jgi:hypothetical protein